jgi:nitrate reductase alpha subunit
MKDGKLNSTIDPELSFAEKYDALAKIECDDFQNERVLHRLVPVRYIDTDQGQVAVTTVFDLVMAQFGVCRGLPGEADPGCDYPKDYDDGSVPYTPAWQEALTGIHRETLIRFAREWAANAEKTGGKNLIIIGAGANHWYHNNLIYRSAITSLMLCGCVGVNGGGLAHYVGQEKLVNQASWSAIAFGSDWKMAVRQQNTPSFHYVHSDQWRYERGYTAYDSLPGKHPASEVADGALMMYDGGQPVPDIHTDHTIDHQVRAVRRGWLPFFPQFNESSLETAQKAFKSGQVDEAGVIGTVVDRLQTGDLKFGVEDPDAPENWPRVWFIWRGNAIGTSAKGHEYFLKHYLGTHTNTIAKEVAEGYTHEVVYREEAPVGKMDLIVDMNFRMDTSALYSDIILPAATWYEKDDLNSTDMHSFINPMQQVVPPAWESKSDWEIYKALAKKVTELAETHLPEPVKDVVMMPLQHDTPDELAQPEVRDWHNEDTPAIPGKTMPKFRVVERDYRQIYDKMVSLGPAVEQNGLSAHGLTIPVRKEYQDLCERQPYSFDGKTYPSLQLAVEAANTILYLDPASNGEIAHRAFEIEEHKTGLELTDLVDGLREVKYSFADLVSQPRRVLTAPTWSGIVSNGRSYSPYTLNKEKLVPWRTLTGRQHFYLEHENYLDWGEALPVYKPKPDATMMDDTERSLVDGQNGKIFNYITPHGKWSIHSTYSENQRMLTLSRGCYPVWINDKDAAELGIRDNDWVELYNDNGSFVQRANVSARIPRGAIFVYHATERTVGIPISPSRGRRAGMNNSLTRARLKPVLMTGGYAQFTYAFNYWGPTGVNRDTFVYIRKVEKPEF